MVGCSSSPSPNIFSPPHVSDVLVTVGQKLRVVGFGPAADADLPILAGDRAVVVPDLLYFVVELALLVQIADFVPVGLVFEIFALFFIHTLPLLPDFLHYLQRSHLWVVFNDHWSCLFALRQNYFFYEYHVSR